MLADRVWTLSIAQFRQLSKVCLAETATDILGVKHSHANYSPSDVDAELYERGVIDEYGVDPEIEIALRILAFPDRAYSLYRWERASGNAGKSVVAVAGNSAIVARASRDEIRIELIYSSHPACLSAAVWGELGGSRSVGGGTPLPQWRVPLHALVSTIESLHGKYELSAKLNSLGCSAEVARSIARALQADSRTEIVASVRKRGETGTSVGTVAVFDGDAGRLFSVPDIASDGKLWVTLSSGTRTRLDQALVKLVESVPMGRSP